MNSFLQNMYSPKDIQFSKEADKVLENSITQAMLMASDDVGTEHIMLAMLFCEDCIAYNILCHRILILLLIEMKFCI
ncbi:MAG: hypothetical protein E7385_00630 [Ruminococcaceae bacterium]|nr:hypothetical protein [Oscillospiraceae bacterium]